MKLELGYEEMLKMVGEMKCTNYLLSKRIEALEELTKAQHARLAEASQELQELERLKAKLKKSRPRAD